MNPWEKLSLKLIEIIASKLNINCTVYVQKKLSKEQKKSSYSTLYKYVIKEAIKIADLSTLYGIASECFELTGDFEFAKDTYQKAIDWCYKINNTSRLHLLGQSMFNCNHEYFKKTSKDIMNEAKRLSDEQKIKNKI